ncbi:GntR family transcriptional regulator [Stakelama pacifica]|uniref:DNA-binding GntR family transcriptional regulator n=1 Tax=Stakelama pacifica TaxID=517720 RepID=A0A4R6FX24_9SPHN|nr:GntR family transcriptional regulator [Stakelama pacifica]TDN86452.1 DNA-binding GntR family transcriptional regulator [Stakelama pacifica]GGO89685.1 transcriptional regulator [Stakelama pacifica]
MSIVVRTLSEQVFEIIRERIISGQLRKDAPIRQDALAAELGVSKIPLREALARLEQEGLLTSHANRGYAVRAMSAEEADEIFALRLAIEPTAASAGALAAEDEDRATVERLFEELDAATLEGGADVAERNRRFHTALVRPGGRLLTTQLVERLAILSERYVIAHLQPAGRESRAHQEHRGLLDAWLARDGDLTAKLLGGHIQGTRDDLREQLAAERQG